MITVEPSGLACGIGLWLLVYFYNRHKKILVILNIKLPTCKSVIFNS